MASITPELVRNCRSCKHELQPGALACDRCHALVYGDELSKLSREAQSLEEKGKLLEARDRWLMGLPLLPRTSKQAQWIEEHAKSLNLAAAQMQPRDEGTWEKRAGPIGVLAVILLKAKTLFFALFKLKFIFSFFSFIAIYWAIWGPKFGIGFAGMILIHEMGHYIDVKRRGLPVEAPVFLPGLGAYVKWDALNVPLDIRAEVSLAGPLAGWMAAAGCAAYFITTGDAIGAALARSGAWLNLFNLIPVWSLDGAGAANAVTKNERLILLAVTLGFWMLTGEGIFFLVALGFGWRLFTKDFPEHPSRRTTLYYAVVMALLAGVLWMVPGSGAGIPR
jgi:Zn-dependent protease